MANKTKARPDRYDIIGLILLGLVVVVWIAHFILPAPPPEPPPDARARPASRVAAQVAHPVAIAV
jgi:hypothetical protein